MYHRTLMPSPAVPETHYHRSYVDQLIGMSLLSMHVVSMGRNDRPTSTVLLLLDFIGQAAALKMEAIDLELL